MIELKCSTIFDEITRLQESQPVNSFFAISSILIVGGIKRGDKPDWIKDPEDFEEPEALCVDDESYLTQCVFDLIALGVRFENPTIKLCNDVYGDDFIANPNGAELTILAWVNDNEGFRNHQASGFLYESSLLDASKTWKQALSDSQSAFIAVSGEKKFHCVSEEDVPTDRYTLLKKQAVDRVDMDSHVVGTIHARNDLGLKFFG